MSKIRLPYSNVFVVMVVFFGALIVLLGVNVIVGIRTLIDIYKVETLITNSKAMERESLNKAIELLHGK